MKRCLQAVIVLLISFVLPTTAHAENHVLPAQTLSLEDCLRLALENNQNRAVSRLAVDIAQAQHEQALSAHWPQIKASARGYHLDEDPLFVFPQETSTYSLNGLPGFPPGVPLEVGVTVPQKDVKIMDQDNLEMRLDLTLPLFTGGRITSLAAQSRKNVDVVQQDLRRTELEIARDVKTRYYGLVMARRLREVGRETMDRMGLTLELTESLYSTGTGRVKKTDYLRHKLTLDTIASIVAELESNEKLARAALVNTLGLGWTADVDVLDTDIPFRAVDLDLNQAVRDTQDANSRMAQLRLGVEIMQAQVDEAKSSFFPTLALFGSVIRTENAYDAGYVSDSDKNKWAVGLALELPLFEGFRSVNKVREAKRRLQKLEKEKILLEEGLALQVKDLLLTLERAGKQVSTTRQAMETAEENRDLHERAYRSELVETKDVIEAQLLESLTRARYFKSLFDHYHAWVELELLIGRELFANVVKGL